MLLDEPRNLDRQLLDRWNIGRLAIADSVDQRVALAISMLLNHPAVGWEAMEGRAAVFQFDPFKGRGLPSDIGLLLARRALDAAHATPAPATGPEREPQLRPWWDCFDWSDGPGTLDRDEAMVHLIYFDGMRPRAFAGHRRLFETQLMMASLAA